MSGAPLERDRGFFTYRGERLETLGNEIMVMTPAEFRKLIETQIKETAQIFKAAGIKPQ